MARRRNSYRRSSAPKRRLFWARRAGLITFSPANYAGIYDLLGDFQEEYGADLFGFTVTRILGNYTFWAAPESTTTTFNLSTGIRVDDESEISGSTAGWRASKVPIQDPHVDWMWARNNLGFHPSESEEAASIAPLNRVNLDLRSQRRLDELGQSLYLFAGLNAEPVDSVYAWYDFHVLCKRP